MTGESHHSAATELPDPTDGRTGHIYGIQQSPDCSLSSRDHHSCLIRLPKKVSNKKKTLNNFGKCHTNTIITLKQLTDLVPEGSYEQSYEDWCARGSRQDLVERVLGTGYLHRAQDPILDKWLAGMENESRGKYFDRSTHVHRFGKHEVQVTFFKPKFCKDR